MGLDSTWRKSTKCGSAPDCVEVRRFGNSTDIEVRNSQRSGSLVFTPEEWDAFTAGVKADEFDL